MKPIKLLKTLLFILPLSLTKLIACGGGGWYPTYIKNQTFNFLEPVLIDLKEDNPLYSLALSSRVYGYIDRVDYFKEKNHKLNIAEWQEYLQNKVTKKELETLFYDRENNLKERYAKLSAKVDNSAFKTYINFVSEQEKFVSKYDQEETTHPKILLKKGLAHLKNTPDNFLKLRYLFLSMRLAHYSGNYKKALDLYAQHYPEVKDVNSIVHEWIDALRAGALQHLGKDIESNLLYGEIFKNNKTNAHLGYYDFKIKNDTQWKNLMAKAKTADDKALFYFLRAVKWDGVPLLEHREMAKLAPKSIWFDRLSYMIMQEFQNTHYSYEQFIDKEDKYTQTNHQSYLEKKAFFMETLSSLKNPSFFSLYSKLYLDVLEQKNKENISTQIKQLSKMANAKEKKFVEMIAYLNGVQNIKEVKQGKNKVLFAELNKLLKEAPASKRESILGYTALHMEQLYPKKSAERLFSKLCSEVKGAYGCWGVESNIDTLRAKEFEHYVEKKERSGYEKEVFRLIMSSLAKNDVARFLTTLYTKDGNFKKANHYLSQVPKLNRKTKFNPFNVSLSGNNRKVKGKGYEQHKFVKTMFKIEQTLEKNPSSAMDHYLYANGLYNSSWFGNFPMAGSVDRSVTGFSNDEALHILENFKPIEKEYQLAEKYAKNPEFKAKIAYQTLKVKQNRFILHQLLETDLYSVGWFKPKTLVNSKEFSQAIETYKDTYGNTKYGKEIIKKCANFRYFR